MGVWGTESPRSNSNRLLPLYSALVNTDAPRPVVAFLGTRFTDFEVESAVLGEVDVVSGPGRDTDQIIEVAGNADVILTGAAPRFDSAVLEKLVCRGIVRLGVGVDTVDLDAARRLGITVAYVPDYGTEAVAIHTVSLIMSALRRVPQADRVVRSGSWGFGDFRPLHLPETLTVGIFGYGRIGRRVGELHLALGFGTILVSDPQVPPSQVSDAALVEPERLLRDADVVTLHAPPSDDGPLLGAAQVKSMKQGSILVNTARGALIDTDALVAGLTRGAPAVAALDVFPSEPPDAAVFETVADSVILTPHMAWYTEESEMELRRQGAAEARRILDGLDPKHALVSPGGRN
ncbi:MAG: C-terminal binding protein [Acidimicrobiia bacterium]|nr:C-terminal binding protein [Acidimicrobiia bacterium]